MRNIPVDVARLGTLMCVVPPEPRVNPETGQVRTDRDGRTTYVVGVSVRQPDTRRADVISVVVSGAEPPAIAEGARVRVTDLVAISWEMGDRHGMSYRAAAITSADEVKAPPVAGRPKSSGGGDDAAR
ncbi:hypothetical protein [Streptomyces sp. RTd22]|uniref:SCO3933 family regulatory protein n=1 Tax=Streptomyces sp. RTd22 TaxID=1841249 RepID=UPI0007C5CC0E|nr:hypothetical protein [Streptomyces sp. RTd22]